MKLFGIILIVFGVLVVVFPEIIAILLGGFFIFVGINILLLTKVVSNKKNTESYVKFGDYKIYK